MNDRAGAVPLDVGGGKRILERVHQRIGPGAAPFGKGGIAQNAVELERRQLDAARVGHRDQIARHTEARVVRGQPVVGSRHEVLTLTALTELSVQHQVRSTGAQRRPIIDGQVQPLPGSAIATGMRGVEAGRLGQNPVGDQPRQQSPSRNAGPPRTGDSPHPEQPLVRRRFDHLVTFEGEGERRCRAQRQEHRGQHHQPSAGRHHRPLNMVRRPSVGARRRSRDEKSGGGQSIYSEPPDGFRTSRDEVARAKLKLPRRESRRSLRRFAATSGGAKTWTRPKLYG